MGVGQKSLNPMKLCKKVGRMLHPSSHESTLNKNAAGKPTLNHITVVIFLEFFAWGLVTTILPEVLKDFFGRDRMWLVLGLMQGMKGLLSFLSAPLLGALSDVWGRKYFLLLTVLSTCLPIPFLFIHNLWWHVIAVAISGTFAVTFSIAFAYVSDITAPQDLSAAFGQVSATFAASLVLSPAIGGLLQAYSSVTMVYLVSSVIAVLDVLFILWVVPESLPTASFPTGSISMSRIKWDSTNPFSSLKVVFKTPAMVQLSAIVFFSYLPEAGEYQCIMLYLRNTLGFSQADLVYFIAILGVLSIVAQTYGIETMLHHMTQKNVILLGLAFSATQLGLFGLCTSKMAVFLITGVAALASITYPALSAMISQSVGEDQQGVVQGLVTGIRSLCNGLGPALFGLLFQFAEVPLETEPVSVLPSSSNATTAAPATPSFHLDQIDSQYPGAPFLVGAGFVLVALFLMLSLPERITSLIVFSPLPTVEPLMSHHTPLRVRHDSAKEGHVSPFPRHLALSEEEGDEGTPSKGDKVALLSTNTVSSIGSGNNSNSMSSSHNSSSGGGGGGGHLLSYPHSNLSSSGGVPAGFSSVQNRTTSSDVSSFRTTAV